MPAPVLHRPKEAKSYDIQLALLESGVEAWNAWREEDPRELPDLTEANLSWRDLRCVDLSGADLRRVDLHGANLHGANLSGANLHGANLSGANLSRADLRGADLDNADLKAADLTGAKLRGVDLSGANLTKVVPDTVRPDSTGDAEPVFEVSLAPESSPDPATPPRAPEVAENGILQRVFERVSRWACMVIWDHHYAPAENPCPCRPIFQPEHVRPVEHALNDGPEEGMTGRQVWDATMRAVPEHNVHLILREIDSPAGSQGDQRVSAAVARLADSVDMLAAVTSETLRGHGIKDIDELLAKLSEAWMLGLGKHIRGD